VFVQVADPVDCQRAPVTDHAPVRKSLLIVVTDDHT
jgi:hypothetical protein